MLKIFMKFSEIQILGCYCNDHSSRDSDSNCVNLFACLNIYSEIQVVWPFSVFLLQVEEDEIEELSGSSEVCYLLTPVKDNMRRSTSYLYHNRVLSGFQVHKFSVGLGEITPINLLRNFCVVVINPLHTIYCIYSNLFSCESLGAI